MRLSGHVRPAAEVNVTVNTHTQIDFEGLAERLIRKFDGDPGMKGRVAAALYDIEDDATEATIDTKRGTDDESI